MDDNVINSPEVEEGITGNPSPVHCDDEKISSTLSQMSDDISYLRDLFVRRLNDDKQKSAMIQRLSEGATFAFIEPFLYDIILLLDRLEKMEDDFVMSVSEELYDIINRRGVERIKVSEEFKPDLYKAVKVNEVTEGEGLRVTGIIRNGYVFSGRVVRPAEVIVDKRV